MMNFHDIFHDFAVMCGKNKILKIIFRFPYDFFNRKLHVRELKKFHAHALEALQLFDTCLKKHGFEYTLAFGSLLGAVREHDFIPHDNDIDVAMWIQDYSPDLIKCLRQYGIKLKHSFSVENDKIAKEDTFVYKKIRIDIFYFYRDNEGETFCYDFVNQPGCSSRLQSVRKFGGLLPRKIRLPLGSDTNQISFKGIEVSIPTNYHEILAYRYGDDYMTPKPGWRPANSSIIEMPEYLGVFKEY